MPISIAIVEDDRGVRASLLGMLQRAADCRCVGDFGSAEEGLRKLPSLRPDVILMDINLPDISGIDALEILLNDPLTAHIPVIAISANAMPHDIKKGMQAGFFRYITKPIKVGEFVDTLDTALERAASDSALHA